MLRRVSTVSIHNQITLPIVFDMNGEVFRTYQGRGVPTLVLVDRQGFMAANIPGAAGRDDLEPLIQHLLEIE